MTLLGVIQVAEMSNLDAELSQSSAMPAPSSMLVAYPGAAFPTCSTC